MNAEIAASQCETVWAIRDARGLDAYEAMFLVIVASRGTLFTSAEVAAADMKMSKSKFHTVSASLERRGLIMVERRSFAPSTYRVVVEAVMELVPAEAEGSTLRTPKGSTVRTEGSTARTLRRTTKKNKEKKTEEGSTVRTPLKQRRRGSTSRTPKLRGGYLGTEKLKSLSGCAERNVVRTKAILQQVKKSDTGVTRNELADSLGVNFIDLETEVDTLLEAGSIHVQNVLNSDRYFFGPTEAA